MRPFFICLQRDEFPFSFAFCVGSVVQNVVSQSFSVCYRGSQ